MMAAVLAVVVGRTARLAVLSNGCKHEPGENNSEQRWVGRWCLRQAFPLLSTLPGSPSACACAVLFVRPPRSTNQTECDQTALTQLHDDLINEDRHVAKYLQNMIHHCPMQNTTQTEKILGAKMDAVTSMVVGLAGKGGVPSPSGGETVGLPDLRTKNLLWLEIQGVPLSFRSTTATLEKCTKLSLLALVDGKLTQVPNLDQNTALVDLHLSGNYLTRIPSLEKNTALTSLYLNNNKLTSSIWSSLGPALTSLSMLSSAHNRLEVIPSWVLGLPKLVYLDLSGNNVTSIGATDRALPTNSSLLLVGGNPVCETNTLLAGAKGGNGTTSAWSSRWNVQCRSQCSKTCPRSIPWKEAHPSWLHDGVCDVWCNTAACEFDGGDCLL